MYFYPGPTGLGKRFLGPAPWASRSVIVAGYACLVSFVEEPEHIFLKTIIPSREATRE
jgi:hypothetical protein